MTRVANWGEAEESPGRFHVVSGSKARYPVPQPAYPEMLRSGGKNTSRLKIPDLRMKSAIIHPMNNSQPSDYFYIASPDALEKMLRAFAGQPFLAVDTESNSLYAYQEQTCLIQFSIPGSDYLVDPLALPDLSALGSLFADPRVEKVFHAAEYDLICLKRDFGFEFNTIFDTMLAARILGRTSLSLGAILAEEFGLEMDKRCQRANWGRRPLSAEMLDYARLDSHYLIELRQRLQTALQKAGLLDLALEDFARACQVVVPETNGNNENIWRLVKNQDITPRQAAILQELVNYRNSQAQAADLPPFKILNNDILLAAALACPSTISELETSGILKGRSLQRHGRAFLRAVQRGMQKPPVHRPARQRPDERYLARIDRLKEWRKSKAVEKGVESDVILPRDTLEEIARVNPARLDELAPLMHLLPWRLNHYGQEIVQSIHPRER
jgi:ribonuclease D